MKNNLSGRAAALFLASLMAVIFSACGDDENTTVQNDTAETTVSETVTEETSAVETSAETTVETTGETTVDTTVSETIVTTEVTSETAKAENAAPAQTEAPKEENKNNSNSGENSAPAVTDDKFTPFIDGLADAIRGGSRFYEGPENSDGDSTRVDLEWCHNGFSYIFTDIDGDGQHELLIGGEHTDNDGNTIYDCIGFVVITPDGQFKNLTSSWSRSQTAYTGGLYFHHEGSGGASLHGAAIYRYDSSSQSFVTEACLATNYDEPDPNELPVANYTLYEGKMWDYVSNVKDDPDALHGEEAKNKWNDYKAKAYAENNKLGNAQWTRVDV